MEKPITDRNENLLHSDKTKNISPLTNNKTNNNVNKGTLKSIS